MDRGCSVADGMRLPERPGCAACLVTVWPATAWRVAKARTLSSTGATSGHPSIQVGPVAPYSIRNEISCQTWLLLSRAARGCQEKTILSMGNCVSRGEAGADPKNPSWLPHPTAETFFASECVAHMPADTHMVQGLPSCMSMDSCDWDPRPSGGVTLAVTGVGEVKPLFRMQMAETKSTPTPASSVDQSDDKCLNELPVACCVTDAAGKEVAWLRKVNDGPKPHKLGNQWVVSSVTILQRSPDSPGVDNAFVRATVTRYPLISTPDIGVSVFDVDGKYTHSGQWFTVRDKSGAGVTAGSKVPEHAAAKCGHPPLQKPIRLLGLPSGPKRRASPLGRRREAASDGVLLPAHSRRFHFLFNI